MSLDFQLRIVRNALIRALPEVTMVTIDQILDEARKEIEGTPEPLSPEQLTQLYLTLEKQVEEKRDAVDEMFAKGRFLTTMSAYNYNIDDFAVNHLTVNVVLPDSQAMKGLATRFLNTNIPTMLVFDATTMQLLAEMVREFREERMLSGNHHEHTFINLGSTSALVDVAREAGAVKQVVLLRWAALGEDSSIALKMCLQSITHKDIKTKLGYINVGYLGKPQ
jgi:hypothetical protein